MHDSTPEPTPFPQSVAGASAAAPAGDGVPSPPDADSVVTGGLLQSDTTPPRGPDRRSRPTPRVSRFTLFGGRRRAVRRPGEREGSFVDQYPLSLVLTLSWVGLMNVGDSFFTLYHLQAGGIELNPFAAMLLSTGRVGFVVLKSLLISLPLVILCLHKNFFLARVGLFIAAASYTLLFVYHLWLL